ncbi:MAG: globin family protein [Ferruginibacter sp.]
MTTKQIELVQNSWQLVTAMDVTTVGNLFYSRLFEIAPEVKPMFSHTSMDKQARKLLSMISYVISRLNNLDDIIDEVKKLAQRHVQYGVTDEHYTMVGRALLWTLQTGLDDKWNDELKKAWTVCYTTLAEAMMTAAHVSPTLQQAF